MQGESPGLWVWQRINQLFNWLPLAALIEKKIICMHGGIGRSIHHVDQIEALQRPITMEAGSMVLMDLLWSDPTENDSVEGLQPNARGPGLVTFGVRGGGRAHRDRGRRVPLQVQTQPMNEIRIRVRSYGHQRRS